MKDFSFQGKVYLGTRQTNGKPGALQWVDDASVLQVKLAADVSTRNESYSGNRLPSARLQKSKSATVTLTLSAFLAANLALGLYSQKATVAGGTVTDGDEVMPTGLAAGDVIALDHGNISALTIKDSTGSPETLELGTDYEVESAAGGLIKILNVGTYTQPFKPAYTYADGLNLAMFTQPAPERYLVLDGVNTVEGDSSPVRVELYRVVFDPMGALDLISADFGTLELTGSVLYDSTNAADANLGGFGKILLPSEA
jgi:hypothetical protein